MQPQSIKSVFFLQSNASGSHPDSPADRVFSKQVPGSFLLQAVLVMGHPYSNRTVAKTGESAALVGRHPTALATPTSWGLPEDCKPGFTSRASNTMVSLRAPCRDSPATRCLASGSLCNHQGRSYNPFTCVSFGTLKPEPQGQHCQFQLPAWARSLALRMTSAEVRCCFLGADSISDLFTH